MSKKNTFFDYEPLARGPRKEVEDRLDQFGSSSSRYESNKTATEIEKIQTLNSAVSERWIAKSGHALSFFGLFLFSFFLFFRPYELASLSWLSSSALITAIATIAVFIPTQLSVENQLTIRTKEVNRLLLLLLLTLISVLFALDRSIALKGLIEYAKVIVMFVVMVNVVRTKGRLKALLLLVLVASIVLSITAFNDYRLGHLNLAGRRIEGAIGGLFENPNDLALHLVTFLPIVIGLGLGSRNPLGKVVYFCTSLILLAGIVVTFSRGGFLGLVFVVGVLVWKLGKRHRTNVVIATVLLAIAFLVLAPGAYRQRLGTTKDESAVARTDELKRSIYLTLRHPLFGVGIGNYRLYSNREQATHNAYTQVASETGLIAAVVYVLFLLAALKRARRVADTADKDSKNRWLFYLSIGLQASMIGYMVTSFFASVAYLWYVYYIAAYIICVDRLLQIGNKPDTEVDQLHPSVYLQQNVAPRIGQG
jgi:probable O-glycosylation ligase (exosortase A-associated)